MTIDYAALVEQEIQESSTKLKKKSSGIDYDALVDMKISSPVDGEEDSSWYEATGISALKGAFPTVAFHAGGTAAAALTPPILPGVGPFAKPAAYLIGGLASALGTGAVQEKAIEAYSPELARKFNKIQREHHVASTGGYLLSGAGLFGVGKSGLTDLATNLGTTPTKVAGGAAALGGTLDVGIQGMGDQPYSLGSTALVAATSPFMLGGTRASRTISEMIEGKLAPKAPVKPGVTPPPETKVETPDTDLAKWQDELSKDSPVEAVKQQLETFGQMATLLRNRVDAGDAASRPTSQGIEIPEISPEKLQNLVNSNMRETLQDVKSAGWTEQQVLDNSPRIATILRLKLLEEARKYDSYTEAEIAAIKREADKLRQPSFVGKLIFG